MDNSIITEIIDCPQCGYPAQRDDYYVVDEEILTCQYCGYSHYKTPSTFDPSKGFGSIHYITKAGITKSIIPLKLPLSLMDRHRIILNIEDLYSKQSSFFVWNEEDSKLDCIVGKFPKTLAEQYEEEFMKGYYESVNSQLIKDYLGNEEF